MANVPSADKQATIIGALAEGSGIRQIERMTAVHRDRSCVWAFALAKACADQRDVPRQNGLGGVVEVLELTGHPEASRRLTHRHMTRTEKRGMSPSCVWTK